MTRCQVPRIRLGLILDSLTRVEIFLAFLPPITEASPLRTGASKNENLSNENLFS